VTEFLGLDNLLHAADAVVGCRAGWWAWKPSYVEATPAELLSKK
jgi:hypothetical protein